MPARPFLLSGGQGLRSLPRRECWPCACVGTLACRCGPSLGGGARGRPGPALSGPSLGLSPVLLCAGHLGGSVEWQEHPGTPGETGRVGGSVGGQRVVLPGTSWRPSPPSSPGSVVSWSRARLTPQLRSLPWWRPLGSAVCCLLPGVSPASSRALPVSS